MTKLYPYQKRGVLRIERFGGRVLLSDAMGLGKTIQALTWLKRFRKRRKTLPAIVVCPASLKWNWEIETLKHIGVQADILEGVNPPKRFRPQSKLIILNYDILKAWLPVLKSWDPQTVVLDECHYAQNRSTQRSKAARNLCESVPYVLALSGTPLTNRPAELWSVLNLIRPNCTRIFVER